MLQELWVSCVPEWDLRITGWMEIKIQSWGTHWGTTSPKSAYL